jgi:hypothetical protein
LKDGLDCYREREQFDIIDDMLSCARGCTRQVIEADAVTADGAVERARCRSLVVLMRRMRDGIEAERKHETDEQRSWPSA